jgi:anti-anti-sigma regulatory factor
MNIEVHQVYGRTPVTVLQPHGNLDAFTYRDLIVTAQEVYKVGRQYIVLDLSDTPTMTCSGLVALVYIAVMLRGDEPPDPDSGRDALRAIDRERDRGRQQHLKLLKVQPQVDRLLETVSLKHYFEVYTDLETAVASC